MSEKSPLVLILGLLLLLPAQTVDAQQDTRASRVEPATQQYTWSGKLKRGALNVVSSPVEIAREIQITTEERNLLAGWTLGFMRGLGKGIWRFSAGLVEVVTFPFDWPDEDKGPIIEPEYVWQKPGVDYA